MKRTDDEDRTTDEDRTMRTNHFTTLKAAVRVAGVLLAGAAVALGQQQVNLTAGTATATLPDGTAVPMWGYSCGSVVTGSTATCASLNPAAAGWSPVVITVPTGADLTINLTNSLPGAVPTSLVIVGQLGGGLGSTASSTPSPDHSNAQPLTWPIAGTTPGNVPAVGVGTPPAQLNRVQSFSTEVLHGLTAPLTWRAPRPGTYLLESGTHPSIQGPMGLYGILVVTTVPAGATPGVAYPGVNYNAEIPLLLSEIDPVQNNAVNAAVNTSGFSETMVWSGLPNGCGNPSSPTYQQCYPPAVNYTPLYYLINGAAFDKTHAGTSLFKTSPATGVSTAGHVLVRFVNAGLRMHVPSIVGARTVQAATGTPVTVSGFSLIAEDGNVLPGIARVQNEVFLAAGKTYDVLINTPVGLSLSGPPPSLPVFDRELSLSGNSTARDAGMLAYIGVNNAVTPVPAAATATANPDTYNSLVPGKTLVVSDLTKGVIANDVNVYGVQLVTPPSNGTVTLNANGTFTYVPTGTATSDSFVYQANGNPAITATVTLGAATVEAGSGIVMNPITYNSNVATSLSIKSPGVLSVDSDSAGYPLTVVTSSASVISGPGTLTLAVDKSGAFNASVTAPGTYTFSYSAQNSQGTVSATAATVTLVFPTATGLAVTVVDGNTKAAISPNDYRWIIEEDRTFYIDPNCTTNPPPAGCPTYASGIVPTFGTNFHTSFMPVVATGCVGTVACEAGQSVLGAGAVCDMGNGVCRTTATQQTAVDPSQVHLDPTKRYYISVLPGDAATPFETANKSSGHGMGGAPIAAGQTAVTVLTQPSPYPPSKLSVFVFEDDFPLNGEQDGGGGIDVLSPNEPGLGSFNITIMDDAGGPGDPTGQVDYDMFNQPLANSLAGTTDPTTGIDACPISKIARIGASDPLQTGLTGTIVTCPKYESDGTTLSPLAGQAVVANMMPGRYGIIATPAADRIARGEEWLQTNTLDGQKAHDSFLRIGEPSFFQEYGPAGFHVSIGFANPAIINGRHAGVCAGTDPSITGTNCTNSVTAVVTTERMSRVPDERLYSSGDNSSFAFTQCYASFGDPDGEDFAFTKCDANGKFTLTGLPDGDWRVTVFDQWNDMLVDGLSTPVRLAGGKLVDLGQLATNQWQANFSTRTFLDSNKDGLSQDVEPGLALVKTNVRFRDGSFSNRNNTDLNGFAAFNEEFPLFSWYVIETDVTRYKNTGTHVVYDAGGPADGTPGGGTSTIGQFKANTVEAVPLPTNLRVPGAVYCDKADCAGFSIATGPIAGGSSGPGGSTGRIDPPWVLTEGWQGFSGQNNFLEFGKTPYIPGENGGIRGHVVYSSTRPFDDPQFGTQNVWEPLVPGVTINLYQEGTAPDGSQSLTLVDTTLTSSWDNWAQGFRSDGMPNMNCPGQTTTDLFYFSLFNQPNYLDAYNNGGTPLHTLPNNSQYKCYDGMHNWNQLQPAPYDGMYQFPSVTGLDPTSGKPTGTNCTKCTTNPDASDPYRHGAPMLPAGKYVVEVVVPPGYELVKEEDKNILIGDNFIAPATVEFPGLGSAIYILPDQAQIASSFNANSVQNPTNSLGRIQGLTSHEGDTPTVDTFWPCVGASRIVPDYISLYPGSLEVAPFAGATRNLCDRKEVTIADQESEQADFFVFTSTHAAAHFTGVITDDFTSEFDPFSPQFGEKFAPPDLPVSIKDWKGNEISRVYADHWGAYNGLTYSTWEVNPPNPTGYSPTMMITCMNDPGSGPTPDPLFNPAYSHFCYEIPFMPGATQYMDTPVTPTSAFAGAGYNNPDCAYPDATPAISEVDGDGIGPWVSATGARTLTINKLADQMVPNNAYSGPSATAPPFNQKTVLRHFGFGTTKGTVTIGGIAVPPASITWSDSQIVLTVPTTVPACGIQQQAQYGGSAAQCGQLVVTRGDNGKQSVDTVTVTIGGKAPTRITAGNTIQAAIDAAAPGDLIIVGPGVYSEMVQMWKPVRLQGVGAASSIIDANTHPAGKLDTWRQRIVCLFGLSLNGTPTTGSNPFDSTGTVSCPGTGWNYFTPFGAGGNFNPQVDRLPLEATVGWDATLNGNLAELLQEPTLMGALEGAAITVLSKGVNFPSNPFAADTFPTGTTLLSAATCSTSRTNPTNPFPSSFWCNPSSIDGLGITDSSQGGGGIFVHAWGHNLQIANNRIYNNAGTLSGGINVGQGEHPGINLGGAANVALNAAPGSCLSSNVNNRSLPYCFNEFVNIHHNAISRNSSTGDELFSATPAGAGGVSVCSGADYYKFNYNWLCGNLSTGDGGGFGHIGFSYNGDIEHNSILFNQSTNPTIPANGGGILIMGAPDVDPPCGATTDQDCLAAPSSVGPSDGTGPGMVINANLIMGNAADAGSGGGLRLQDVNGSEVVAFPGTPSEWYTVQVTNNIIANNVAGWDGAGISLQDALAVNIINNTIMSNDTTASAGVLFNTLGAPLASSGGPTCTSNCGTTSLPQPAGLVAIQNSAVLQANLPTSVTVVCPAGHYSGASARNGSCRTVSYPELYNDVFWQNRSFYIGVGPLGTGTLNQQNVVALYNAFTTTQVISEPQTDATTPNGGGVIITGGTGACVAASYWDIGVRGDTGPSNHASTVTLAPTYSVLTDAADYPGNNNLGSNPTVVSQYCNGSRTPPEFLSLGYQVPPGISDATVPNPIFNLTPAATVDEGNNWINLSWGPLALTNTITGVTLGNYALAAGSPAIDYVPTTSTAGHAAPTTDFFGNPRPDPAVPAKFDVGAVEFQGSTAPPTLTAVAPNTGRRASSVAVTLTGTNLTGTSAIAVSGAGVTVSGITVVNSTTVTATFTITAGAALTSRNVTVTTPGGTSTLNNAFTVVAPTLTLIAPNTGVRGTNVPVTLTGTGLTGATAVTVSGTGVTASAVTVVNDTTVTATLAITATAGLTARNVSVTTPGGATGNVTFTVTGPTLASIAPITGGRGTSVPVTITGSGLTGSTAVTVSGTGVTVSAVTVVNDTTVTATFTITAGATLSARNVNVTTPIGTAGPVTFTVVAPPAPTLASIAPTSGTHNTSVPVTLTGTNFTATGTTIAVTGTGVTASGIVVNAGGTQVTATFAITNGAAHTARTVTVTTPGGTTTGVTFTVN